MTKASSASRKLALPVLLALGFLTGRIALAAGGETCATATVISSLPYVNSGDTTLASDDIRITECAGFLSMPGPDHVYQFTVATGNNLTFTLTLGDPEYDASIYIRNSCAAAGVCVAQADVGKGGQQETLSVAGLTPGTYFFFIDSPYVGEKEGPGDGPYTLTVTGSLGAPNNTSFYTLTPCRVLDTRGPNGHYGGPALVGGAIRDFVIPGPPCGVPSSAKAISINATVTQPTTPGYLTLFPGGASLPLASTINFSSFQTRANNAIMPLGAGGTLSVFAGIPAGNTAHFILDVNGYFQ